MQAIVSLYGASNLQSILGQSTEFGLTVRIPALKLLLGDVPDKKSDLAKLASPVDHLDKDDPPLLLIHGGADPQMPPAQSAELEKVYPGNVTYITLPGSKHGGPEFYDDQRTALMVDFIKQAFGR